MLLLRSARLSVCPLGRPARIPPPLAAKRLSASSPAPPRKPDGAAPPTVLLPPSPGPREGTEPMAPSPPTWVDKMPAKVRPYLYLTRIDKPIGTWLLLWPCTWSILLSSTVNDLPLSTPLWYCSLFGVGALVMRGAGCTINDMWDRKFDAQASVFLVGQLSAGLAVLTQLNPYSIALGASSLGLVAIYPAMKRITYWPQSVLGLAFNWGSLLGWSAVAGHVDWAIALPLYAGGAAWTIVYDTIYAHQDKSDDIHAGVKSTALLFGDKTLPILSAFSASFIGLLAYSGTLAGCSPPFFLALAGTAGHLVWQLRTVRLDSRESCWRIFKSNKWLGGVLGLGFLGDWVWRVGGGREFLGLGEKRKEEEKEI